MQWSPYEDYGTGTITCTEYQTRSVTNTNITLYLQISGTYEAIEPGPASEGGICAYSYLTLNFKQGTTTKKSIRWEINVNKFGYQME